MLLVDDHPRVRAELKELLQTHAGFEVLTDSTVNDALKTLQKNAIDVVLADWKLGKRGEADGGDLLAAVESWHRGVGRVLLSGDPIGAEVARSYGFAWASKDASIAELILILRANAYRA